MKKMSVDIELQKRLISWSWWKITIPGYPKQSSIFTIGLPANSVRYSKPPYPLDNDLPDEMNGWINIMGYVHKEYKEVIKKYYLSDKNTPIWQLAKQLNIPKRTFEDRLRCARAWLSGCLAHGVAHDVENNISRTPCRPRGEVFKSL